MGSNRIYLHIIYLTIPFFYAILYIMKGAKGMKRDWVERLLTGILIFAILAVHFFLGDFLFGRHEVETYTVDCEVIAKYVKDGEGCYVSFRNNEVHGDCFVKYEMWQKMGEGDWVEIEIQELENYLKSWNEYEIVGLAQER